MSIPDYQSLMLPVLSASLDGEIRIGDLVERLAEKLALTPEERAELLPSGKQTPFSNRVHWAKTYLSKAGLLESTRRVFQNHAARVAGSRVEARSHRRQVSQPIRRVSGIQGKV
jgi:restriction endonuclease Mrr